MLKGIDPILSPELLKILAEMGHGDEIILADAHFPGATFCPQHVLRGDGWRFLIYYGASCRCLSWTLMRIR